MINSANISGSFPPDAQSSDTLRPQSGQEPGKALNAAVRQFEEGMMDNMSDAIPQGWLFGSGQARFNMGALSRQTSQDLLIDRVVDLAGMMVKRLSSMPEQNVRAENIAAEVQAFAVSHLSPHLPVSGCAEGIDKKKEAFVVRRDRGGGAVLGAGTYEPWREAG